MVISINKFGFLSKIFIATTEEHSTDALYACSVLTRIGRALIERRYPDVTITHGDCRFKVTIVQES
jgi:hypothetical protein